MGCFSSSSVSRSAVKDESAVNDFLEGGTTLDDLWNQFDKNGDGQIDETEFENLVYTSLKHFCIQRNPGQEAPSKESMGPFIHKLIEQLRPYVDKDRDNSITKAEFSSYGKYLTSEFRKLRFELESKSKD